MKIKKLNSSKNVIIRKCNTVKKRNIKLIGLYKKLEKKIKQSLKVMANWIEKYEKILTVIILFFTLLSSWIMVYDGREANKKLVADNNKAILKIVRIDRIDIMPQGHYYSLVLSDDRFDNKEPYHNLYFKLIVKNVGNGILNNLMVYDMHNLELQYSIFGNIKFPNDDSLNHIDIVNYVATYSSVKEVHDNSYCVLSKDEEETIYVSCAVNDENKHFSANAVFLYQDIYNNVKSNVLTMFGDNDLGVVERFMYDFMPQNIILDHSLIKRDDNKLRVLSELSEWYSKIFNKN